MPNSDRRTFLKNVGQGTLAALVVGQGAFALHAFAQSGQSKPYYVIDPAKCNACGDCAPRCRGAQAISAVKVNGKDVYVIDPAKCTGCGKCVRVCQENAISEKERPAENSSNR
jgi:NAD-dependent dihydropyrimidine dehydrogenase PreA subunit